MAKHNISKEVRNALHKDIVEGNGLTLTQIAEKNNVEYGVAMSVFSSLRSMGIVDRVGVVKTVNGTRMSDGHVAPVKSFNINDLTDDELRKRGLERFIKPEVK
ncbi:hypothetical protein U9J35_01570 [Rossellomorea aquimaris]|nr:hypothetical protein [Rossellomorea aquimaris]WRP06885.1 hypothetical protein U9J35_01570 [Rossellomorea aquimaris]